MNYETIEVVGTNGTTKQHIIVYLGSGSYKAIFADESNPEYVAFLDSLNDDTETE
jgi:hypothetical protein